MLVYLFFFFSSRRRHTIWNCDWSSDVCSSDLVLRRLEGGGHRLASYVVGRPAEPAGDEHEVGALGLGADELRDPVDFVGQRGHERDRDAELLELLREPGSVRVDGVAGEEL